MSMNNEKPAMILVAEDELDLSGAIKTALTDAGYDVVVANDGEEAWAKCQELAPDLVLLDLNMPKVNGLEVLRAIREDAELGQTLVTILTAYDNISNIAEVTEIGGMKTDFLTKSDHSLEQIVKHVRQRLGA